MVIGIVADLVSTGNNSKSAKGTNRADDKGICMLCPFGSQTIQTWGLYYWDIK